MEFHKCLTIYEISPCVVPDQGLCWDSNNTTVYWLEKMYNCTITVYILKKNTLE